MDVPGRRGDEPGDPGTGEDGGVGAGFGGGHGSGRRHQEQCTTGQEAEHERSRDPEEDREGRDRRAHASGDHERGEGTDDHRHRSTPRHGHGCSHTQLPRQRSVPNGPVTWDPMAEDPPIVATVDDVVAGLAEHRYLSDRGLATAVFLSLRLGRPLLLEGEAGVGKTEVAKVLSAWLSGPLIRLQCYEGIDIGQAVYEWDYSRQLLHLRTAEATGAAAGTDSERLEAELYTERFLVRRPLLQAIDFGEGPAPVLLVDEIDRADDEFEAFLLEALSDFAITIPELGTFRSPRPPIVVITSNRTRDVHDALKRRCLYHWVEHPDFAREVAILRLRAPEVPERLARQVAALAQALREQGLYKPPGIAEAIDWVNSLALLGLSSVDAASADASLGAVLKYREDQERVRQGDLEKLVAAAVERGLSYAQPGRGRGRVRRGAAAPGPSGAGRLDSLLRPGFGGGRADQPGERLLGGAGHVVDPAGGHAGLRRRVRFVLASPGSAAHPA